MKPFSIILISVIFLLGLLIVVLLWSRSIDEPVPLPVDTDNPNDQNIFPIGKENKDIAYLPQGYSYQTEKKDFDSLVSVVPSKNFTSVLDSLYLDYYAIVSCRYQGSNENVIRLLFDDSIASRKSMSDYELLVYGWESDIARDIGDIIFSNISSQEREKILQFSSAQELGFRSASLLVNGEKRSLHYGFIDNVFYLASSMECIEATERAILGPNHEHD